MSDQTQLLREALVALQHHEAQTRPIELTSNVIFAILEHLSAPAQPASGEAVAWVTPDDVADFGKGPGESIFMFAKHGKWTVPLCLATPPASQEQARIAQLEKGYHSACKLVADMHAAAVGAFGQGPKRGVVEDVADLYAQVEALTKENTRLKASQEQAQRAPCDGGTCGLGGYCDKCPKQAQPSMKDGEIAALVNKLRDIAIEFHGQQQLRERIAGLIVPVLKAAQPSGEVTTVAIDNLHNDRRDERTGYIWPPVKIGTRLYTAPQPAQPAARVAMTEADHFVGVTKMVRMDSMQRSRMAAHRGIRATRQVVAFFAGIDAAEAHHGITSNGATDA